jgi:Spy/CpxP family protein refolding chaperone
MATRFGKLILAAAISVVAGGALAQTSPDTGSGGAGPGGADGASHGWKDGQHGAHERSGGHDGGDGDDRREGRWGGHGHHHHHHHHHHRHWGHRWGHEHGNAMHGGMLRAFHELNLTAAQKQQMQGILANARQQFESKGRGGAPDILALANPGDPNYAAAVQAAKKRAADRIQKASDIKMQLYNVLTPDQKTQLSKNMVNWKARMAQRAEGPKGQPAPANR